MEIGQINNWNDINNALDKLTAMQGVVSRRTQLEAFKSIRQRACDLPPDASGEETKEEVIGAMSWAIELVEAELTLS